MYYQYIYNFYPNKNFKNKNIFNNLPNNNPGQF